MQVLKVGRRTIEITNTSKEMFPKDHITKGDVIDYYSRIADIMVPHMKNRPITMQRFPNGIGDEGFYQKDSSDYFPSWIKTVSVKRQTEGSVNYVLCNDAATLVYLANQLCLTPHLWLSKKDKLDYPDRMIFDLDAAKKDFAAVRKTAFMLKDILEELDLVPFVMTTGSRGLHVVVPLKRQHHFDEVRAFAREIAQQLVDAHPRMLTLEVRKEKRRERIFLDILRNAFAQTGVAPYAIRAKPGAPIATPITWQELKSPTMHAQRYTIKTIFRRLSRSADPWRDIDTHARSISGGRKKLVKLVP
jgi:bifunctional non-homologous end joining protein LigD